MTLVSRCTLFKMVQHLDANLNGAPSFFCFFECPYSPH